MESKSKGYYFTLDGILSRKYISRLSCDKALIFLQLMPCTAGLTGAMCVQLLAQGKKTNSPIRVSKQDFWITG